MGARLEEYKKVAPDFSFIHVDQFSGPSELAKYLHQLDQDDEKYNQYFQAGHPHPPSYRYFSILCHSGRAKENSSIPGFSVVFVPYFTTKRFHYSVDIEL